MIEGLKLYSYWRSSCSWRVRIGLELKGLKFESVPIHLVRDGGAQNTDEYAAINALNQVPVLEWQSEGTPQRLSQSLAILRFLDTLRPDPPLEPISPLLCARAWEAAELINAGIQPLQNLRMLQYIDGLGGDRKAFGADVIQRGFVALERLLERTAGSFSVGHAPSVADACLVPQLYNARRFDVDLSAFPTLTRVESACVEHPAFRAARPEVQPDAEVSS